MSQGVNLDFVNNGAAFDLSDESSLMWLSDDARSLRRRLGSKFAEGSGRAEASAAIVRAEQRASVGRRAPSAALIVSLFPAALPPRPPPRPLRHTSWP